jgi:hypothetical protein
MAVNLPNGSTVAISSGFGTAKTMSAITNAAEAVATLEASHGVVENDILVITSGWSRLNGRVARADSVSTNDVTLEDIKTSDTGRFPNGGGAGSVKEVTGFTQISQMLEISTEGGDQQFTTYSFLEDDTERQIPTQKSPVSLTMQIADDQSLAHYALLDAADEDRQPRVLRVILPSGAVLYYNGYVTLRRTPTLTKNEVMALQVTFSLVAEPTRYAS